MPNEQRPLPDGEIRFDADSDEARFLLRDRVVVTSLQFIRRGPTVGRPSRRTGVRHRRWWQRSGGRNVSANWVPQVVQMKLGMDGDSRFSIAFVCLEHVFPLQRLVGKRGHILVRISWPLCPRSLAFQMILFGRFLASRSSPR